LDLELGQQRRTLYSIQSLGGEISRGPSGKEATDKQRRETSRWVASFPPPEVALADGSCVGCVGLFL
jgi:hypothetical protein